MYHRSLSIHIGIYSCVTISFYLRFYSYSFINLVTLPVLIKWHAILFIRGNTSCFANLSLRWNSFSFVYKFVCFSDLVSTTLEKCQTSGISSPVTAGIVKLSFSLPQGFINSIAACFVPIMQGLEEGLLLFLYSILVRSIVMLAFFSFLYFNYQL